MLPTVIIYFFYRKTCISMSKMETLVVMDGLQDNGPRAQTCKGPHLSYTRTRYTDSVVNSCVLVVVLFLSAIIFGSLWGNFLSLRDIFVYFWVILFLFIALLCIFGVISCLLGILGVFFCLFLSLCSCFVSFYSSFACLFCCFVFL